MAKQVMRRSYGRARHQGVARHLAPVEVVEDIDEEEVDTSAGTGPDDAADAKAAEEAEAAAKAEADAKAEEDAAALVAANADDDDDATDGGGE